jgi:hypothetical protein
MTVKYKSKKTRVKPKTAQRSYRIPRAVTGYTPTGATATPQEAMWQGMQQNIQQRVVDRNLPYDYYMTAEDKIMQQQLEAKYAQMAQKEQRNIYSGNSCGSSCGTSSYKTPVSSSSTSGCKNPRVERLTLSQIQKWGGEFEKVGNSVNIYRDGVLIKSAPLDKKLEAPPGGDLRVNAPAPAGWTDPCRRNVSNRPQKYKPKQKPKKTVKKPRVSRKKQQRKK